MKRIISILTIICFWQGLFAQITSVGELFGGRESGKLPHREIYGFFLSNKNFDNNKKYGFGKFFIDSPVKTELLLPFGDKEGVYAGAAVDGIYYACTYFNRAGGPPAPGYFISYDMNTGKRKNIGKWTEDNNYSLRLQDMTFDYSTRTLYGLMFEGGRSMVKKIDVKTGKMTEVCTLEHTAGTLAADKDGTLYALSVNSTLYKIDKATGSMSIVVNTDLGGLLHNQTMEFDHTDGMLYWAAATSSIDNAKEAHLIRVDVKNAGKQGKSILEDIGVIGSRASVQAMYIPFALGGEAAPKAPKNLSIKADESGQKMAVVSWTNPDSTFGGEKLSAINTVTIIRDDKEVAKLTGVGVGQKMTWQDTGLPEDREYKYIVYASNDSGDGQTASASRFIGFDAPAEVPNIKLDIADGCSSVKISWNRPTAGLNGGVLSNDAITYKIVRSDNSTVAENLTATDFTDNKIDNLGRYWYTVFATNKYGHSETLSPSAVLGKALLPPLVQDFSDENVFWSQWNAVDNNKDNYSWMFNVGMSSQIFGDYSQGAEYIINPTFTPDYVKGNADEWLITPPILFEAGKNCKITIRARSLKEEKIIITKGKANVVDKQQIIKEILIPPGKSDGENIPFGDYEVDFPIETGVMCIGINLVSPVPQDRYSCLQISSVKIEQAVNTSVDEPLQEWVGYKKEGQLLTVQGDFIAAYLYSKTGALLVSTQDRQIDMGNLPMDIYVLVIDTDRGKKSYKLHK